MTPSERYEEACKRGIDPKEYCIKVLHSTNPEAAKHKGFCLVMYTKLLPVGGSGKDWWRVLKEKEEMGFPLEQRQREMWRIAYETSGESRREPGEDS